jgi:hypothetical protein
VFLPDSSGRLPLLCCLCLLRIGKPLFLS